MTSEYVVSGVPFLRSKDIKPYRIDLEEVRYVTREFHGKLQKSALAPGDVVVVRTGDPGTAAVVPDALPEANCADLVVIRPTEELNPKFLAYYLNAGAQDLINSRVVGAVQQHFNVGAAKKLEIPSPARREQDRIVDIVGALDEKISANSVTSRTLEASTQCLFKSWFVDFDPTSAKADGRRPSYMNDEIAAFFPERFVDSELGAIPEGWVVRSIAEIARYVNGKNFTSRASGTGRMVIRIAELNSGPGSSTVYNDIHAPDDHVAVPDDILFAWSGSLGVYRWHGPEALVNQHIFKVIPNNNLPPWFVYFHVLEALPFFAEIAAGKATTMGHIKRSHLREVLIALPPVTLLESVSQIVRPLYDLLHVKNVESRTLAELRDLILLKLLSGEILIRNAEDEVEAVGA